MAGVYELGQICLQLDTLCPDYEFFYSVTAGGEPELLVYESGRSNEGRAVHIPFPNDDRDYVITKIMLMYAGGTISA